MIRTLEYALRLRGIYRKTVFTNGCFDLFHIGHLKILQEAGSLGGLIVAVNTDESIRCLKGIGRPIIPFYQRAEIIAALSCVKCVIPLADKHPDRIIADLQPHIIVDSTEHPETAEKWGSKCDVRLFENSHLASTTQIIDSIKRWR